MKTNTFKGSSYFSLPGSYDRIIVLVNGRIKRARDNAVVCSDTVNRKYDTVLFERNWPLAYKRWRTDSPRRLLWYTCCGRIECICFLAPKRSKLLTKVLLVEPPVCKIIIILSWRLSVVRFTCDRSRATDCNNLQHCSTGLSVFLFILPNT